MSEKDQEIQKVEEQVISEEGVEDLIKKQLDIPEIVFKSKNKKSKSKKFRARNDVCFCHEDLFDSESVHHLLKKDYKYYLKYKRFNSVFHFNHNQEPFSYMYEREYWDLRLFDKFQYLLREFFNPLKSGPFSFDGKCVFFEFETLYRPSRCDVYTKRSYEIVKENLNRFNKIVSIFNRDTYEDILVDDMDMDDHPFDLPNLLLKGRPQVVHVDYTLDSFEDINADRHKLPREFFGSEDKSDDQKEEKANK